MKLLGIKNGEQLFEDGEAWGSIVEMATGTQGLELAKNKKINILRLKFL